MGRLRLRQYCRSSLPIDIDSVFAGMAFRFGGADRGTTMSSGITVRNIDPGDEARRKSEAHRCGIAMEELVRRRLHEKREKAAASLPRSAGVVSGRSTEQIFGRRNVMAIDRPHSPPKSRRKYSWRLASCYERRVGGDASKPREVVLPRLPFGKSSTALDVWNRDGAAKTCANGFRGYWSMFSRYGSSTGAAPRPKYVPTS